jgi:hypothetical protein
MSDTPSGLNAPVQQSAPSGTPSATPAAKSSFGTRPGKSSAPEATESFSHSWKSDDGEEHVFKSRDELNRFIRDGTLRHKDYTKKTQEAAELRKQAETRQKELENQAAEIRRIEGQWKPVDEWLKSRPDVARYIQQNMRNPSPDTMVEQNRGYVDEQTAALKKELEELKSWKDQQSQEVAFEKNLNSLKEQYPDLDEDSIRSIYKEMDEAPESDSERKLLEMFYWVAKGRNPQQAPVAAPKGLVPPVANIKAGPVEVPKNLDEARRRFRPRR